MVASIGLHWAIKVTEVFEDISLPLARLILCEISSVAAYPLSNPGKPFGYLLEVIKFRIYHLLGGDI